MKESKKLKYRYFFLSFSVAFLVLSLLFFFLMNLVHPSATSAQISQKIDEVPAYAPVKEDSLTVLFVGVAPDSAEADTFILARFDPVRGKVPVVAFPRDTAVDNKGKTETLAQVYKYGGADSTRRALEATLGIPINRYVRMDTASFILAANTVGSVEFDLSLAITLGQSGEMPMTLSKGKQLLDGQKVADLIHFADYPGGELVRCETTAELTAAIVNQRIDITMTTVVDKVFEKIINLIDTDISYPDYDNRKEAAAFLAQLGREPAEAVPVGGQYGDGMYRLSDTFVALMTQVFV